MGAGAGEDPQHGCTQARRKVHRPRVVRHQQIDLRQEGRQLLQTRLAGQIEHAAGSGPLPQLTFDLLREGDFVLATHEHNRRVVLAPPSAGDGGKLGEGPLFRRPCRTGVHGHSQASRSGQVPARPLPIAFTDPDHGRPADAPRTDRFDHARIAGMGCGEPARIGDDAIAGQLGTFPSRLQPDPQRRPWPGSSGRSAADPEGRTPNRNGGGEARRADAARPASRHANRRE